IPSPPFARGWLLVVGKRRQGYWRVVFLREGGFRTGSEVNGEDRRGWFDKESAGGWQEGGLPASAGRKAVGLRIRPLLREESWWIRPAAPCGRGSHNTVRPLSLSVAWRSAAAGGRADGPMALRPTLADGLPFRG